MQNFEISITRDSWEKIIPENVCELINLWFKSARNFVAIRPEIKSTERNKSQCTKSTIACNGKTAMPFFVQLCSQNNQSDTFKIFSAFKSSIKAFDNIFGNNVFLMNTVLLEFQTFAFKP